MFHNLKPCATKMTALAILRKNRKKAYFNVVFTKAL